MTKCLVNGATEIIHWSEQVMWELLTHIVLKNFIRHIKCDYILTIEKKTIM